MSKTYNFDNGFSVIAKPSKNDSYDVVVQYEGKGRRGRVPPN